MKKHLTITCLIALLLIGCEEHLSPLLPKNEILDISFAGGPNFPSDGVTVIPIIVNVNEDNSDDYRVVTVYTDAGHFVDDDSAVVVNLSFNTLDTVFLIAGTNPGVFNVYAQTNTDPPIECDTLFTLDPVLPETLSISQLSQVLVDSVGGSITVEVAASRVMSGKPSEGVLITFNAFIRGTTTPIGLFTPSTAALDASQKASTEWSFIEGGIAKGTIIDLTATVQNSPAVMTTRSIKIN